jgi:hypothetical protein
MKIEIYDPAMCCSSGLCGPAIDPALLKMNDAILALKRQGGYWGHFSMFDKVTLRQITMDLLYRRGGMTNPEIGLLFGVDYSGVTPKAPLDIITTINMTA